MKTDARGLPVSTNSDAAIAAIDRYCDAAISLKPGMEAIVAAANQDPGCAMLQACAASLFVYAQSSVQARRAAPYLARAHARKGDLTDREAIFIDAVAAGCDGDFARAIELYEKIADRWPRDLLAAKLAEFHCFETGLAGRQLRLMEKVGVANPDSSHAQAMLAFALELTGNRARAEEVARVALAREPLTMWAQHALAHVLAAEARTTEGIAMMEGWAPTWRAFGQYIQSHNSFHLANFYRAALDFDRVLDTYRRRIWGFQPDTVGEQTDAILALWYVELAGGDVGGLWRDLAPYAGIHVHEQVFPFLSAIYLFALERAGETAEVDRAMDEIRRYAETRLGPAAQIWGEVGLGTARGSIAYARGNYDRAAELFGRVLPMIAIGGGSDEQRGVFHESHFMSLIKAGRKREAASAISQYVGQAPKARLEQRWVELATA